MHAAELAQVMQVWPAPPLSLTRTCPTVLCTGPRPTCSCPEQPALHSCPRLPALTQLFGRVVPGAAVRVLLSSLCLQWLLLLLCCSGGWGVFSRVALASVHGALAPSHVPPTRPPAGGYSSCQVGRVGGRQLELGVSAEAPCPGTGASRLKLPPFHPTRAV